MKKKGFMTKVAVIDILVVSILLIAGLIVPVVRDLMMSYDILIYGVLCINLLVDLLLLVLNKFKKAGNILQNMAIFLFVLKLLVLFMASLVFITISLAN